MEEAFDRDRLTDIEIAMYILRLMDNYEDLPGFKQTQSPSKVASDYIKIAENTAQTMTNPFAKSMLMNKIAEQKNY